MDLKFVSVQGVRFPLFPVPTSDAEDFLVREGLFKALTNGPFCALYEKPSGQYGVVSNQGTPLKPLPSFFSFYTTSDGKFVLPFTSALRDFRGKAIASKTSKTLNRPGNTVCPSSELTYDTIAELLADVSEVYDWVVHWRG